MDKDFNQKYKKVKQRIVELKEQKLWDDVNINTEIVKIDKKLDSVNKEKLYAIVKATVEIGGKSFTAHAMETEGVGDINYLHFIENAETSAVGRALSFAGIKDEETPDIASKEEIEASKEQLKDVNIEKRKEVAQNLIEQTLQKKQLGIADVVKPKQVKFDESNIPVFAELGNNTIRPKADREKIITWLKSVNKFDENVLIGALIASEMSIKFKTFNDLINKGSYQDILNTFKHL